MSGVVRAACLVPAVLAAHAGSVEGHGSWKGKTLTGARPTFSFPRRRRRGDSRLPEARGRRLGRTAAGGVGGARGEGRLLASRRPSGRSGRATDLVPRVRRDGARAGEAGRPSRICARESFKLPPGPARRGLPLAFGQRCLRPGVRARWTARLLLV